MTADLSVLLDQLKKKSEHDLWCMAHPSVGIEIGPCDRACTADPVVAALAEVAQAAEGFHRKPYTTSALVWTAHHDALGESLARLRSVLAGEEE